MKRLLLGAALTVGLAAQLSACTPRSLGNYAARAVVRTAVQVAVHVAIHGIVTAMIEHDSHYHHHSCGHRFTVHDGRDVYEYNGHWEYYDRDARRWYYYRQ